ncbi:hypothetical protein ACJW31_02G097100 [Castanea mollissima]
MGGGTSGWRDACGMGAGISGLLTTRAVVAHRPRLLAALVLRLAVAGRPRPLAVVVLGLAVAGPPRPLDAVARVGVLTGAVLVLGVAVAADSVSCPLFASPFAAGPPPSPARSFRTRRTWLCARLPTGSISNSAK